MAVVFKTYVVFLFGLNTMVLSSDILSIKMSGFLFSIAVITLLFEAQWLYDKLFTKSSPNLCVNSFTVTRYSSSVLVLSNLFVCCLCREG